MANKQVSFRLPEDLWDRAEKLADHMNEHPEYQVHPVSPSRVLIMAMQTGLQPLEDRYKPKRRKARRR